MENVLVVGQRLKIPNAIAISLIRYDTFLVLIWYFFETFLVLIWYFFAQKG